MLKALIFDVDGTLADTELNCHRVAFNNTFASMGLDWYWDEALYLKLLAVPGGKERVRHYIEHYHPKPPVLNEKLDETLDDFIRRLHSHKIDQYLMLLNDNEIPARPGVSRLLMEANAEGLRLSIASTSNPVNIIGLLFAALGPVGYPLFEIIAGGDIVPHKKPASDIYQYVLKEMELEPHECLAIEDSEAGLKSALGAGIPTIITVNDFTAQQDFTGALLVVNHLGQPGDPSTCLSPPPWPEFRQIDVETLRRLHASTLNS